MRLINTISLTFREFFDSQRPPYAILSHTWEDQEVSYLDFLFLTSNPHKDVMGAIQALLKNPSTDSRGFKKITSWCKLAHGRGYEWVWIDTCCIDKSSSAELSEAINSTWRWYREAQDCFVYLLDVSAPLNKEGMQEDEMRRNQQVIYEQLSNARWFTRGWTLQELLAPKHVLFCNNRWEVIASKSSIGAKLSEITRIPLVFLDGTYAPNDGKICSVATRMSWVSQRQTTRLEDMAYCMLGLFDVHMPLIYGEERKAFMRLQLEIIKKSDDDSIYAWHAPLEKSGMLATWPTAFVDSGNIAQITFPHDDTPWEPPAMTSIGLEFRCMYTRVDDRQDRIDRKHAVHTIQHARPLYDDVAVLLHCTPINRNLPNSEQAFITQTWGPRSRGPAVLINLRRFGNTWQRVDCAELRWSIYGNPGSGTSEAYAIHYVEQQGM